MNTVTFNFNHTDKDSHMTLGNILILGSSGSGKTVYLNNILNTLSVHVAYGLKFYIYDVKGEYSYLQQLPAYVDYSSDSVDITCYLRSLYIELFDRQFCGKECTPAVFVITEGQALSDLLSSELDLLVVMLEKCAKYNTYIIIICGQPGSNILAQHFKLFKYTVALRMGETASHRLLGSTAAAYLNRGEAIIFNKSFEARISIPFLDCKDALPETLK